MGLLLLLTALLPGCGVDVPAPPAPPAEPAAAYEALLERIVTPDGRVDYDVLRADPAPLQAFVGWVAEHGPESDGFKLMDDDRRLAWHLNAYNALVLWGVLQSWPIGSVHDVPGPFGAGSGFFWKLRFAVDGERRSLHDYEQVTILSTYQEPLSHAALNCASRSCPPLRAELYTQKRVDDQLADQMRRWVAGGAVTVEGDPAKGGTFVFNAIFDWYAEDFRVWAGAETPCAAVAPYAVGEIAAALAAAPGCPHRFAPYDWALNAGTRAAAAAPP